MRRGPRLLLGAAGGIAVVTLAARAVGFGRVAVLSRTLGTSCVGDVYTAANAVPNLLFDVVAGGALAAVVVPVVAGAVAAGDRDAVSRSTSALLTWTVALLVPVVAAGVLVAPTLVGAVLGDGPACRGAVEAGSRMLVVLLPQVVLYGVGAVLAGVLQAHRRFLGPALAPLLSSLVVLTTYLVYAAGGRVEQVGQLSRTQELVLTVGTTLGVAVLSLGLLVPLRSCGLHLRPSFRFPSGEAARARRLATGGVAALAAQQVTTLVALRLAAGGAPGDVVVLTVATAVFLLPWAVLAVPIATSAFPALTAAAADDRAYATALTAALRAVLLASGLAAAVLVATAGPLARLLVAGAPGVERSADLARALMAFAPGLVGYGLLALLARACYARGLARGATLGTAAGWLAAAAADLALVRMLPEVDRVVLLGAGHSLGVTVGAAVLLATLRDAVDRRAAARSGAAAAVGAAAALALAALLAPALRGTPAGVAAAVLAAAAAAAFLPVARRLDPAGLRELLRA